MLTAHVPDLQVHIGQRYGRDVLTNGRYRVGGWGRRGGNVYILDGIEKGSFPGVIEAKKENGIFCDNDRLIDLAHLNREKK